MSRNEGNLGAIQSYDSEILTAGTMQKKAINSGAAGNFLSKSWNSSSNNQTRPTACTIVDSDFQKKQVQDFITRLYSVVLIIKPVSYSYTIDDYIKSNLGKAAALDEHVSADFVATLKNFYTNNNNAPRNANQ
ncbi:unnamed protein product [Adineta ricciae]|uniref:Uncharacterized protein n=1 Tax=Adineta ricciae TaxID=249248 RepID=A0A815F6G0_ADIRI|nr:unnamed protein product [Adineta ricciae]CAF1319463.1 unnamed protein product [Adineta ricciae]